jgi:RNA polymerase sigma-70 factor, ECF subfamily
MDEEKTIIAIQNGDINQYAELVERYWIGLVIYCEHLANNRADAEDIAQKSFIKAYEQLASYKPNQSRFSTWLYRIARNTAIDLLRTRKQSVTHDEDIQVELFDPTIAQAERTETVNQTRKAVQSLEPKEQRKVIEDYYWQGKSYQMMADEMGVSINTVKTWMHRAKQQLRSKLS